jgi:hypothetical protein
MKLKNLKVLLLFIFEGPIKKNEKRKYKKKVSKTL